MAVTPPVNAAAALNPMSTPRRRYTVSEKVLAASRANLVKANAARRALHCPLTERQQAACRENLLKAQAAQRRQQGGRMRLGVYCCSLERSLRQAGERLEDFQAHLQRVEVALRPKDRMGWELAWGWAEALWRRARALRGQARWEAQQVAGWMRQAPARRRRGAAPGRAAAAWLEGLLAIFLRRRELEPDLVRLNRRLRKLGDLVLVSRWGVETGHVASFNLLGRSAAAAGNPFRSPSRVARTLEEKPVRIAPCDQWRRRGMDGPSAQPVSFPRKRESTDPGWRGGGGKLDGPGRACRSDPVAAAPWGIGSAAGERDFESFAADFRRALGRQLPGADEKRVGLLAEAVWDRLRVFEEAAAQAQAELEQALERALAKTEQAQAALARELAGSEISADAPPPQAELGSMDAWDLLRATMQPGGTGRQGMEEAADRERSILLAAWKVLPAGVRLSVEIPGGGEWERVLQMSLALAEGKPLPRSRKRRDPLAGGAEKWETMDLHLLQLFDLFPPDDEEAWACLDELEAKYRGAARDGDDGCDELEDGGGDDGCEELEASAIDEAEAEQAEYEARLDLEIIEARLAKLGARGDENLEREGEEGDG